MFLRITTLFILFLNILEFASAKKTTQFIKNLSNQLSKFLL